MNMSRKNKGSIRYPQSVGSMAVVNVGFGKARQALTFSACWWIAGQRIGHDSIEVDAYAKWWGVSRAQAFRMQQTFRLAFPGYNTPTDLHRALGLDLSGYTKRDSERLVGDMFQVGMP
jgi:hypothetical protein